MKISLSGRLNIDVKMTLTEIVREGSEEENVMEDQEHQTPTQRQEELWRNVEDPAENIMLIFNMINFQN